MKKFILKNILFILILVSILLSNYTFNQYFISKNSPIFDNLKVVIAGDSHIKEGVNPEQISNSITVAQLAEPYFITYYKLKELLRYNKNVDTIILGFSVHNFSGFNDVKLIDKKWSATMFDRVYPLITLSELRDIPFDKNKYYQSILRNLFLLPKTNHITYIEPFEKNETKLTEKNIKPEVNIQRHYFYNNENVGISDLSVKYLNKITELAKQENVQLYLVSTPLHPEYVHRVPGNFTEFYIKLKEKLKAQDIKVLDYINLSISEDHFRDFDHLNYDGAILFTDILKKEIN